MAKLSIETCVAALNRAAFNRKAAFQIELATGLAMFLISGSTDKEAKQSLCAAYASAGYACASSADMDYKTVNRRINVSADLFNTLGADKVAKWASRHTEALMLDALVVGLKPYELYGVRDVERLCTPAAPKSDAPAKEIVVTPAPGILAGPAIDAPSGQQSVINMFKRATAEVKKGARHIETEHLAMMVPPTATYDELVEMAGRLLSLAEEVRKVLAAA